MGLLKVFVISSVLLPILVGYLLYVPIPDGYSTSSSIRLQLMLGSWKAIDFVAQAASYVGINSYIGTHRLTTDFLLRHFVVQPNNEIKETDAVFDGVPVRIYEQVNRPKTALPGIVYYHGGGFTFGDLNMVANIVRRLSKETNSVVVSVDYRLAPEHPFPAAFEDCVAATKYFLKNAAQFGVDAKRVAVAGDSAGGNLATVVSLKLRDDHFTPAIKLQVLLYPVVQGLDLQLPSMIQNANGPLLIRSHMAFHLNIYMEGNDDHADIILANEHVASKVKKMGIPHLDVSRLPAKYLAGYQRPSLETGNEEVWEQMKDNLLNVYFSPLLAPNLEGLPTAYVFTAEFDPLRDEGFLYVYRLKEAGVKVEHVHSDIGIHGIMTLIVSSFGTVTEAEQMFLDMCKFIVTNL